MTQAEAMRQVTEERDMLRERLLQYAQPLARSSTASADWIAAAYSTNSRPAQSLSGKQPPVRSSDITIEARLNFQVTVDAELTKVASFAQFGMLLLGCKAVQDIAPAHSVVMPCHYVGASSTA